MSGGARSSTRLCISVFILPAQRHVSERMCNGSMEPEGEFVEVIVPLEPEKASVPGGSDGRCVTSHTVLEAVQASPGRIDGITSPQHLSLVAFTCLIN